MAKDDSTVPNQTPTKTLLILSQVYPPDPTSVGQHIADVAEAMAKRGYNVLVLTANRGYNDPSVKYASKELRDGVNIRRLPLSSFGKRSILLRLLGQGSFWSSALCEDCSSVGCRVCW